MTDQASFGTNDTAATAGASSRPDPLTEAATALVLPFTLVRQLLPDSPVPVALGAGALAVAGVIEWPMAAAVGLGYLAVRRWRRPGAQAAPVR